MAVKYYHNFPKLARDSGFLLKDNDSDGFIDWRFIASIDTNRIIKDSDFEKLEECLPHLINSALGNVLNTRILDPAIGKFYTISQLSIQYLLFCKEFLDKTVNDLRDNIFQVQKNVFKLEKSLRRKEEEIQNLQKKVQKHENKALTPQAIYPCKFCSKNFASDLLLSSHISRKHQNSSESVDKIDKDTNLIQTIKLELEIKQLKEKLMAAEKEWIENSCVKCDLNSVKTVEVKEIGIQSNFLEPKEVDVKESQENELKTILNQQQKQFQDWKKADEKKYNTEISELRSKLDETIELLKKKETEKKVEVQKVEKSNSIEQKEKENENLWKIRFKEMETMYQENQKKTNQTLENLEKIYNEKLKKLEDSMKKPVPEVKAASPPRAMFPESETETETSTESEIPEHKTSNLQIFIESQESEEEVPIKLKVPVTVEPPRSRVQVMNVGLRKNEYSPKREVKAPKKSEEPPKSLSPPKQIKEISSESSDEKLKKRTMESPPKSPGKESKKSSEVPEKPQILSKIKVQDSKAKIKAPKLPSPPVVKSALSLKSEENIPEKYRRKKSVDAPITDAVKLFKNRLTKFGISAKEQKLSKNKLEKINEDLAKNREQTKKKHKSFFITRKALIAKVDKIMKEQNENSLKKEIQLKNSPKSLPELEVMKPKEVQKFRIKEKSPLKVQEVAAMPSPKLNTSFLVKEVKAKKEEPKIEVPENPAKNIRENLEKLLKKQMDESTLTLKPTLEDMEGVQEKKQPIPKPAIRKKVLFNLEPIEEASVKGNNPVKSVIAENNSDSDWNISSIED